MSQVIQKTRLNRFHAISSYVHSMHVLLAAGTVIAPAVALIADPPPVFMWVGMMLAVLYISIGASLLVVAEYNPYHRLTRWLYTPKARKIMRLGVFIAALIAMTLASVTNLPLIATAVPLAWALTAVCYGSFWNGVVRLFIVTISIGLASLLIHTVIGDEWEPLALVIAALLALGILGQDSIYILAIQLDDLRTREAERAIITERQRFASDLHDIQGQHLSLITVESELVMRLIERAEYSAAAHHADRIHSITIEALDEMHRVVYANREVHLDDEITNAIRVLRSAGISVNRDTKHVQDLSNEVDNLLGLTVRESITNILKHTQAQTCLISTQQERRNGKDGIVLIVADSGNKPTPLTSADVSSGTGLKTLTERYHRLGGTLYFIVQDNGSRLTGWLPYLNGDME